MKFDIPTNEKSIIKVIGVGGGGGNAVSYMYKQGITGVDFAICNTDHQALENSDVPIKISLGPSLTEGMGAGSQPETGKEACIESIDDVRTFLNDGTKMLFITAGMGGGTGTGAAPIIAKASKELGILTVAIVTLPFNFEGMRRKRQALEGLESLKKNVDAILVISNDKIKEIYGSLELSKAFSNADNVLNTAAKAIAEIITVPGYINVDFKDVNFVMRDSGVALMGSGMAEGTDRARKAIDQALNSPLLEENDIRGAKHLLINITSGTKEASMDEVSEIMEYAQQEAGYGTDLIFGTCQDKSFGENLSVTIIATGFDAVSSKNKVVKPAEIKVPLETDFDGISDINDYNITEVAKTSAHTFDFDEDDFVKKSVAQVTDRNPYHSDPFLAKQTAEERSKMEEAESARRHHLRSSTTIALDSPEALERAEKVPAYLRRGTKLDEEKIRVPQGRTSASIYVDDEGTVVQTGNSFIYEDAD